MTNGLWNLPLQHNQQTQKFNSLLHNNKQRVIQQVANAILRKNQSRGDLANYLHGCVGSSSLTTLQKAINKRELYNISWH